MMITNTINTIYLFFFSEKRKKQFERVVHIVAILAFVLHCVFIVLVKWGILPLNIYNQYNTAPNLLSAIYTPFSIIILYEIYLLIYYLPKSINIYLGKQYEIIALILIRKIFDVLANISAQANATLNVDLNSILFTFFALLLLLLLLIFCFYKLNGRKKVRDVDYQCTKEELNFVLIKKCLSILLLIVFVLVFIFTFFELPNGSVNFVTDIVYLIKEMSNSFFNIFFTALIITEVLLLLFTFNISDTFSKVIRNSGFIISTILLKLSFRVEGENNLILILVAVAFGVAVLGVYRLFSQKLHGR